MSWDPRPFWELCRKADEKQCRKPPGPHKSGGAAAESTVEALMFSLRERGTAAMAEPETRRRLADLSSIQVRGILARLIALRPSYPAIDDDLLFLLGEQLS